MAQTEHCTGHKKDQIVVCRNNICIIALETANQRAKLSSMDVYPIIYR